MNESRRFEKPNPTRKPPALLPSDLSILAEIAGSAKNDFFVPAARSTAHHQLTGRTAAHHPSPPPRSKPPAPQAGELTSRQLAAARLVVQGRSSSDVAKRIGTIRQTINRWKKLPQFQAELRRMHELLVREISR